MDAESQAIKRFSFAKRDDAIKRRKTRILDHDDDLLSNSDSSAQTSDVSSHEDDEPVNIDSLPDDILLILLSYLNTTDLLHVRRCNRRIYNVSTHKVLWTKVNAVSDGHKPLLACIPLYLHGGTVSLKFHKNVVNDEIDTCFGTDFFNKLQSLSNLRTLVITNHNLTREMFDLRYLPGTITELRLTRTKVIDSTDFLTRIEEIFPNLELIDLSFCNWFDPQLLVPLAKCHSLKTLLMVGCCNMKDIIPYASIAAAYGYRQLETLDMRLTGIVDREISCFNKIKSLKHIYLERPANVEDGDESITDICITSLGMRNWLNEESNDPSANRVLICRIPEDGGNFIDHVLETLVVCNYPKITDITLKHAEKCLRSLKYLDVSGSSCSAEQIAVFRRNRPEVRLIV